VPATAVDEGPHIERHRLAVLAKVTQLGCWLPTVNLDQLFTKLGGHPSGFEQELSKCFSRLALKSVNLND
jgi:hypothetical protein